MKDKKNIHHVLNIKEINKEAFLKFKKVRELENSLYGKYVLFCKDSQKYIAK
jgi:hypothetical protein